MVVQQDKFQLALAKQTAGKNREAIKLYSDLLNADPGNALAYHNLGLIVLASSGAGAAIPLLWYASELNPKLPEAHNSLANAFLRVGRHADAEAGYRKAIELAPRSALFQFNLGNLVASLGRHDEAERLLLRAAELDPATLRPTTICRMSCGPSIGATRALEALGRALAINPKFAMAHNNIGNIKRDLSLTSEAEESYRTAIEIEPTLAIAHFNLGNVLRETGRAAESAASFRKAFELNPSHADAYRHLVQVEKVDPDDGLVAYMQSRYETSLTPDEDKKHYAFALGRVFDQAGQWDRAFDYFLAGNRLHRETYKYDIRAEDQSLKRIRDFFTPQRLQALPISRIEDSSPIFIVGMMRSGTTLMEQILASHPQVAGGGELIYVQDIVDELRTKTRTFYPNCMEGMTQEAATEMGGEYVRRVREAFGTDARFITDKMPQNFIYLGLIDRILPNARIIYMQRDPMDVSVSIFSILFTEGHPYAYDLKEIAQYSRFSERVMAHWMSLFGHKIHTQSYEALVADPEREIRKVLDFCGLEFDPACLDFHATQRKVTTASASQVRERLNANSVGRWKSYERHLRPLKAVLAGN